MALFRLSWLRRRRQLPAANRPPLAPDERVVAWADSDGGILVATNLGLWLPTFLPWHLIHKATWDGTVLAVTPAGEVATRPGYTVVEDRPVLSFRLADPGDLPHQVRARVTRSVGYTAQHPLPGARAVRVAARRVPGADGLRWTVRYDRGVDPEDPGVVRATTDLVGEIQAAVVVPPG
jgi:hypothetical protein